MARNGRFDLGLKVLLVLAALPDAMVTSVAIAEKLGESAVMVRRAFLQLHAAGLLIQRKGPSGGAKLRRPAKEIGLGDVFIATGGDFAKSDNKSVQSMVRKAQQDAVNAMNETTLSQVVKRMKKG